MSKQKAMKSSKSSGKKQPQNPPQYDADVIIVGGGLSGLSMTCLLASHGVSVICIDRDTPVYEVDDIPDGRTTAISYGSHKVLAEGGIWEGLAPHCCPIEQIDITDGDSPILLSFSSEEVGGRIFGWIAENRYMRVATYDRLKQLKSASHIAPATVKDFTRDEDSAGVILDNGETYRAKLVIGADGRNSFTRDWMGIDTRSWPYNQTALICNVFHENPHDYIALENFRTQGPFAILPMTDDAQGRHRSSLVWSQHGKQAFAMAHESEDVFNAALNARFPERYGHVELATKRQAFPLNLIHAHQYIAPRMALIADAAHGMHPIAGQGLNMGYRDVAALGTLIIDAVKDGKDAGAPDLLESYQRQRRFDNMTMMGATDTLTRLFSSRLPGIGLLRKFGLKTVATLPPAKQFFMKQAMGASGLLPAMIRDSEAA